MNAMTFLLVGLAIDAAIECSSDDKANARPTSASELPLVYRSDFEAKGLDDWTFTDPNAWKLTKVDGTHVLDQYRNSDYTPEVRSPLNIALIPEVDLGDFVLDLEVRSTGRDYGHRDLCFFFGHTDTSHFYYVHLGKLADPHAHSIFLVNGSPRVSIAQERTQGVPWTNDWHHVRIERRLSDGLISVYFDDMINPIMTTRDNTLKGGRLGVGSFDDTGQFRSIRIWGKPSHASEIKR